MRLKVSKEMDFININNKANGIGNAEVNDKIIENETEIKIIIKIDRQHLDLINFGSGQI